MQVTGTARALDSNSGTIGSARPHPAKPSFKEGELDELFEVMDVNADGVVSFEEFKVAVGYCNLLIHGSGKNDHVRFTEAELRYAFDEADADGNKSLTRDEFTGLLQRFSFVRTPAQAEAQPDAEAPASNASRRLSFSSLRHGLALLRRQHWLAIELLKMSQQCERLPSEQRALAQQCFREVCKAVPFLLIVLVLPGGLAILPALVVAFPRLVPVAFRDAIPLKRARTGAGPDEFQKLTTRVFRAVVANMREQRRRGAGAQ